MAATTYPFDLHLTDATGLDQTGLVITIVNIIGGVAPISLTEKGNGWYSNTAVPQGVYLVYKEVSGTPTSTGIYIDFLAGIKEEDNGFRRVLDQTIKSLFKVPQDYAAQGYGNTAEAINDCLTDAASEGVDRVVIPPGDYYIESTVSMSNSEITLEGYGAKFHYPVGSSSNSYPLLTLNEAKCKIKGVEFDGDLAAAAQPLLLFNNANCDHDNVEDCLFDGSGTQWGISLDNGSYARLINNRFSNLAVGIEANDANFSTLLEVGTSFETVTDPYSTPGSIGRKATNIEGAGEIVGETQFESLMHGIYYDGTNYRKQKGYTDNYAFLVKHYSSTSIGLAVYEIDVSGTSDDATVTPADTDIRWLFDESGLLKGDPKGSGSIDSSINLREGGINFDDSETPSNSGYRMNAVAIGDWDMDSNASLTKAIPAEVKQGQSNYSHVVSVNVVIVKDDDAGGGPDVYPLDYFDGTQSNGSWMIDQDADNIILSRFATGTFDSANFDKTSYSRGYIYFTYYKN